MNIIETDRFVIRNWMKEDAEGLVAARKDPSIAKGLCEPNNHPYTLNHAIEHIRLSQKENNFSFVITIDNKIAGEIGNIFKDKPLIASVNYWLSPEYRGKGIAAEALDLFTDYNFKKYPIFLIEALVFEWNKDSISVLKEAGYVLYGTIKGEGEQNKEQLEALRYFKINRRLYSQ
jgi:[ribosomal protein S5]-alanine N-acetyltransferase